MYGRYSDVLAVFGCIGGIWMYRLYSDVSAVFGCIGSIRWYSAVIRRYRRILVGALSANVGTFWVPKSVHSPSTGDNFLARAMRNVVMCYVFKNDKRRCLLTYVMLHNRSSRMGIGYSCVSMFFPGICWFYSTNRANFRIYFSPLPNIVGTFHFHST